MTHPPRGRGPRRGQARADTAVAPPGSWRAGPEMPYAGFWAQPADAAALLGNGGVLLAGGEDGRRVPTGTSAVFAPATGLWTTARPLSSARRLHTVTRLMTGQVLVAGGIGEGPGVPGTGLASAELYDPGSGAWTPAGEMNRPRFSHSATALADGRVLVAGGCTGREADTLSTLRCAELYDPDSRRWTPVRAPMTDARFGHPAVPLSDGRVLLVGGGDGRLTPRDDAALYDPRAGTWTQEPGMAVGRVDFAALVLADGSPGAVVGPRPPPAPFVAVSPLTAITPTRSSAQVSHGPVTRCTAHGTRHTAHTERSRRERSTRSISASCATYDRPRPPGAHPTD
ncbi:Kelch repeat-containing protein [Streptomyces sp. NPDC051217]|uniref:Kelch repeat-containing protein n=1 Tax=Streptomyces sp. NPDC051217 TaxID=3365644 RepID=UPI0037ABFA36